MNAKPGIDPLTEAEAKSKARWANVKRRCIGGAVAIAILSAIATLDRGADRPWIGLALATLLGVIGANEFFAMLEHGGIAVHRRWNVFVATLILVGKIFCDVRGVSTAAFEAYALGGTLLAAWAIEVVIGEPRKGVERVAYGMLGVTYVALYSFLMDVMLEFDPPRGIEFALWLVFVSKSNDIGGFLIGNLIGGKKLAPKVSPGKTWAGSVGGVLLSLLAAFCGAHLLAVNVPAWELCGFALAISIATQFGDLAESLLKRACDVKDSGSLLPTFGGALDVIDSLAFAAPCGYVLLRSMGVS